MKCFFKTWLFTYLAVVFVFTAPVINAEADQAERVQKIATLLESDVKTVQRSFFTFHWEKRSEFNGLSNQRQPSDPEWAKRLVKSEIAEGLETDFKYAYYVALDPFSTRSYGGPYGGHDWLLIQTEMPDQMKYLDLYSDHEIENKLSEELKGLNCKSGFPITSQPDETCRKLSHDVLGMLNVDAVKYFFGEVHFERFCSGRDDGAFVIIKSDWLEQYPPKAYLYETGSNQSEREVIQDVFAAAPEVPVNIPERLWTDIEPKLTPGGSSIDWMHAHLLNCL